MADNHSDGRSQGGGGHGGSSGRWLVSYADFVTLMFVVFVVLYAMANVDNAKFQALKESLGQSTLGGSITPIPTGGNPINTSPIKPGPDPASAPGSPVPAASEPTVEAPPLPAALPQETATEAPEPAPEPAPAPKPAPKPVAEPAPAPVKPPADPLQGISNGLKGMPVARAGEVTVAIQDRGVVASVLTSVLFAEGQAELKPGAAQLLDQISEQLRTFNESILVEGAPDEADKEAPWDLASRRASTVVGYLVNTHGLAPHRFSVIGYGKGAGVDGVVNVVVLRRN